jgi:hypothetical protein
LYHTSAAPSEGGSESSIDYLSQGSPIFGPPITHGRETPTSSYGSVSEPDPLYLVSGEESKKSASIVASSLSVQLPEIAFLPPEIKIAGPGSSSPQSSHTAPLRSRKGTSASCTECRRRKQKVLLTLFSVKSIKIKELNSATKQKMAHATIVRDVTLQ